MAPTMAIAQTSGSRTELQPLSRLTQVQSVVDVLASASFDFLIATMVLAILTAVLLESARDFGLRSWVSRTLVRRWGPQHGRGLQEYGLTPTMFGLQPDELAGQIAALLRPHVVQDDTTDLHQWLDWLIPTARASQSARASDPRGQDSSATRPSPQLDVAAYEEEEQGRKQARLDALAAKLDIAIDQLQVRLRSRHKWVTLGLALLVACLLTGALLVGVRLDVMTTPIIAAVAFSAALATPLLRDLIRAAIRAF